MTHFTGIEESSNDVLNQLKSAYIKGPFEVHSQPSDDAVGMAEEDFRAEKPLTFMTRPAAIFKLDYSANSVGIDMGRASDVLRLVLKPIGTTHRIGTRNTDVYYSDDNVNYARLEPDRWTLTVDSTGRVTIEFSGVVRARYFKIHCKFDERDSLLKYFNAATFMLEPDSFRTSVWAYELVQYRTEEYTYDKVGNRETETIVHSYVESRTYTYYTNSDRLKTDGRFAFVYDDNGNLIKKGNKFTISGDTVTFTAIHGDGVEYWEYDYDLQNRLVAVRKSGLTADDITEITYTYDPTGLRLVKSKPGEIKYYAFDLNGNAIYDTVAESGKKHCYIWAFGKTLVRVDDGPGEATATYYLHTDMLGSVVAVTDESGNKVWEGDYAPFGERVGRDEDSGFDLAGLYTGKEYDEDTGLYYFNARWYDSVVGEFISEDQAKDPNNPSLYSYCANNPLMRVDPSGESWIADTFESLVNFLGGKGYKTNASLKEEKTRESNQAKIDRAKAGIKGETDKVDAQACLSVMGFPIGSSGLNGNGVDGQIGGMTKGSIKAFQKMAGLEPTGELDEGTLLALKEATLRGLDYRDLAREANKRGVQFEISRESSNADFVNAIYYYSVLEEDRTGIPAAITTAQIIQESGYGKHVPTDINTGQYSYNLGGIKGVGPNGSVLSKTWEIFPDGSRQDIEADFRAYHNFGEFIQDHSKILVNNPRYGRLFDTKNLTFWAYGLGPTWKGGCGYATDEKYGEHLMDKINYWGLK